MAEPKILIIAAEAPLLGAEICTILDRIRRYKIHLSSHPFGTLEDFVQSDLVIPVLSAPATKAVHMLSTLRVSNPNTQLLPVLDSEELTEIVLSSQWINDFLVTPIKPVEVLARVGRLLGDCWNTSNQRSSQHDDAGATGLAGMVGEDPAFIALKRKLPLVARQSAPVLITGETGTGKEIFARALHYLSARVDHPFLPVNCGAIPNELFESELFGHRKGAFTGAWSDHAGLVEEAAGGTLFLDEIESLSLPAQVKLLRFIEDHTYHSVGSAKLRRADVCIVAATNLDLPDQIRQKTFREDLFYRLAVINLRLPPLRDRRRDVPLLIRHFWSRHAGPGDRGDRRLSTRAIQALSEYAWPGNIRELQNVIQQLAVLNDKPLIEPEDLPISVHATPPPSALDFRGAKAQAIAAFERNYLEKLLQLSQGNVTRAAKAAHKDRRSFSRLIRKHHL